MINVHIVDTIEMVNPLSVRKENKNAEKKY